MMELWFWGGCETRFLSCDGQDGSINSRKKSLTSRPAQLGCAQGLILPELWAWKKMPAQFRLGFSYSTF